MSVDPTQIVEDVGCAVPRDDRIVEIGLRRANGKIAYLQFKFEDLSSGRLPRRTALWPLRQFNLVEEWDKW